LCESSGRDSLENPPRAWRESNFFGDVGLSFPEKAFQEIESLLRLMAEADGRRGQGECQTTVRFQESA
jgi:hypothetical protein